MRHLKEGYLYSSFLFNLIIILYIILIERGSVWILIKSINSGGHHYKNGRKICLH